MRLKLIFNVPLLRQAQSVSARRWCASKSTKKAEDVIDIASVDTIPIYADEEDKKELEKKRNKSRLNPQHRNILFGEAPYSDPMEIYHNTLKYKRRMLGRYGMNALDVPVGVVWPTVEELEDKKEYERVAFPHTLEERWEKIAQAHREREEYIMQREKEISEKMDKMETWIQAANAKREKKKRELAAAIERKKRLIDEVRKHFDYKISQNDERFKEMLLKKEKEDKKKMKQAKKQARQDALTQKLEAQSQQQQVENKENESKAAPEES